MNTTAWQTELNRDAKTWGASAFLHEDGCTEASFLEYAKRNGCTYSDGTLQVDYDFAPAYESFVAGYDEQASETANFDWEA